MDKGSENFVSAFAFGYFCLRENKMLFLQYGNDEDEEIFLRLAFMQSLGGAGCCTIFFSCDGQSNRPDEPSTGGRGFRVSYFDRYCACGDRYGRCVRVTPRAARYFFIPGDGGRVCAAGDAGLYRFGCHARSERRVGGGHQVVAYFDRTS